MKISNDPLIIPESISSDDVIKEVEAHNIRHSNYSCPNCQVENTHSQQSIGWVHCPIFNRKYICEGCCIDVSSAARTANIDEDLHGQVLNEIAHQSNKSLDAVRLICLDHQTKILASKLANLKLPQEWRQIREKQMKDIENLRDNLFEP